MKRAQNIKQRDNKSYRVNTKSVSRKDEIPFYGRDSVMARRVICNLALNDLLHWHNEIELIHVLSPEINLYIEGETSRIRHGDTAVIMPGVLHDTFCAGGGEIVVVQFPPDSNYLASEYLRLFRSSKQLGSDSFFQLIESGSKYGSAVGSLCKLLLSEMSDGVGSNKLIIGAVMQLLGYIERISEVETSAEGSLDITSVAGYIEANAVAGVTLAEAAKFAGYSENYFSTCFRQAVGSSFKEYLSYVRMRKAQRILLSGKLNVSETALMFGYDNVQNFSRAFKKVNRLPPGKCKPHGGK